MNATAKKSYVGCWNCKQPATHVMTRKGSNTLHACDNCTRIDRAEAELRGWTIKPLNAATKTQRTKVELADGRVVALTETQVRAVKAIHRAGAYHAYDGINRATIRVLERLGLVTVEWKTVWVETCHGYRGVWKQRPQLEWTARINEGALTR